MPDQWLTSLKPTQATSKLAARKAIAQPLTCKPQPTRRLLMWTNICSTFTQPSMDGRPQPGLGEALPHLADCVYLDYNATTPIWPQVAEDMEPYLHFNFGNPSSSHYYGTPCKAAVELARQRVADLVGASPQEIHFASCGTESDNWAIWGAVMAARRQQPASPPPHVVTSCIEHPAVLEALQAWREQGLLEYTAVPVDGQGLVSPADVAAALQPHTALVTIMHSNNEVGSLQPVKHIAQLARDKGVLVHADAAQSIGKVAVDVKELGVDMLTIVGHKFGAPKGVAALYIRQGVQLAKFLHGGGQESGKRAGTENVLLLVGLGRAAEIAQQELNDASRHMAAMRDRLKQQLLSRLPEGMVRINGPSDTRQQLPNTLSISLKGISASGLLGQLSSQLAASAGAACHSHGGPSISSVLAAMQVPEDFAVGTLRLSCGRHTTAAEVDRAVELIVGYVQGALPDGRGLSKARSDVAGGSNCV